MEFIKSKKYTGVYYRQTKNNDFTYYFTYKNEKKLVYHKVGLKSQGLTEQYVADKRSETILALKNGEVPTLLKNNKKYVVKFDEIAQFYFTNRNARSNVKRKKLYELRLKPDFGDKNINTINPTQIINFRNKFVGRFVPHTINIYLELMSTIFNYYIKHQNIRIIC